MFSTDTYQQLKKASPEFEELAAMQAGFSYRPVIIRRDQPESVAQSVMAEFVSGNYFRAFGLQPRAGRLFVDSDDKQGALPVVVMSYQTWKRDYAADPSIVGHTFWVNTKPATLIGIAPEGFFGDRISTTPPNFYLPIEAMPALANAPYVHDPATVWLYMIGRVKPGITTASLENKLSAQLRNIFASSPRFSGDHGKELLARAHLVLVPGGAGIQSMQEQYGSNLRLLMWIAGLVLLIACANIANLLLVRGLGRRSEMSLRTALGAMRRRLIRQLLTECIVLAGIGGIVGLVVAYVGTRCC